MLFGSPSKGKAIYKKVKENPLEVHKMVFSREDMINLLRYTMFLDELNKSFREQIDKKEEQIITLLDEVNNLLKNR